MALRYSAERVLIRCPNWIGDMVAATAAVRCVRRNYPDAHVSLLLRPYVRPVVENAKVGVQVTGHGRGKKVIAYKYKRRKNYHRKVGHRQEYTELQISEIRTGN